MVLAAWFFAGYRHVIAVDICYLSQDFRGFEILRYLQVNTSFDKSEIRVLISIYLKPFLKVPDTIYGIRSTFQRMTKICILCWFIVYKRILNAPTDFHAENTLILEYNHYC